MDGEPRINRHLIEAGLTHALTVRANDEAVSILDHRSSREIDRIAEVEYGIPTLLLMENAAIWLAAYAAAILTTSTQPTAVIVAGKGNNGGDGLAMARHLSSRGWDARIVLAVDREAYVGDALVNLQMCEKLGLTIFSAVEQGADDAMKSAIGESGAVSLIVDALLGTGLSGPLKKEIAALIRAVNRVGSAGIPILAVDIPSGLDADSGKPSRVAENHEGGASDERLAVRADVTVTLVGIKPGFLELAAQEFVGELLVAGIGVPRSLVSRLGRPLEKSRRPGGGVDASRTSRQPLPNRRGEPKVPKRRA